MGVSTKHWEGQGRGKAQENRTGKTVLPKRAKIQIEKEGNRVKVHRTGFIRAGTMKRSTGEKGDWGMVCVRESMPLISTTSCKGECKREFS